MGRMQSVDNHGAREKWLSQHPPSRLQELAGVSHEAVSPEMRDVLSACLQV